MVKSFKETSKNDTFLVYVLNRNGQPLMPTNRYAKVRKLLKTKQAKVIQKCPFTIQLLYETTCFTQDVTLGIDAGSKHVGVSATTTEKVLYEAEVELRNDIVELLSTRRELRRTRRNRKTRYRKARFNNRKRNKGWLAPSVQHKIDCHMTIVNKVCKILPVTKIIVEVAAFDIQKIKNPDIAGEEYQHGEMYGFNSREYVLFRDGHVCQCCKGKSKDKVLETHHIESRKTGGDAPNNLITLCKTCHDGYHDGIVTLPSHIKRGMKFNDATFMGIMRWSFYNMLKERYQGSGIEVTLTYGYITKNTRIEHNLPKAHCIDARCISENPDAKPLDNIYRMKKVRHHNRQIHKLTIQKDGTRKRNTAPFEVKGYRLFDKVRYEDNEYIIFGRRSSGYFDIRTLDGNKINNGSVSYKKLALVEHTNGYIALQEKIPK